MSLPDVADVEAVNGFQYQAKLTKLAGRSLEHEDQGACSQSTDLAGQRIVIEYSSPNTNKPQHLGHCRNNILGAVTANLLEANAEVIRVNLINDRGIHRSMVAYQAFGEGVTPESIGKKGDHLIGDFYVRFETAFRWSSIEVCRCDTRCARPR